MRECSCPARARKPRVTSAVETTPSAKLVEIRFLPRVSAYRIASRIMKLIEAVPNISEGARGEVIDGAAAAVSSAPASPGLLDVHRDADHNRSVFTLAGSSDEIRNAVLSLGGYCADSIDLNAHVGVHPRMGALDVVPFVPLGQSSMAEAVACARESGAALWERFGVPVYLYGDASMRMSGSELPAIRVPFEKLGRHMAEYPPDFGDPRPHPTAGAVAVGARPSMVAFNVWIEDSAGERDHDELARIVSEVAAEVRERGGGLPGVRALGLFLPSRSLAQVSMNLTEPERAGVGEAFEAVQRAAVRRGVGVRGGELVGLAPAIALAGCSEEVLEACGIGGEQVLENRIA